MGLIWARNEVDFGENAFGPEMGSILVKMHFGPSFRAEVAELTHKCKTTLQSCQIPDSWTGGGVSSPTAVSLQCRRRSSVPHSSDLRAGELPWKALSGAFSSPSRAW